MKTLKYGDEVIVIEDEDLSGKTGIAIHDVEELEDTVVIDTKEIRNALEDTLVDLEINMDKNNDE